MSSSAVLARGRDVPVPGPVASVSSAGLGAPKFDHPCLSPPSSRIPPLISYGTAPSPAALNDIAPAAAASAESAIADATAGATMRLLPGNGDCGSNGGTAPEHTPIALKDSTAAAASAASPSLRAVPSLATVSSNAPSQAPSQWTVNLAAADGSSGTSPCSPLTMLLHAVADVDAELTRVRDALLHIDSMHRALVLDAAAIDQATIEARATLGEANAHLEELEMQAAECFSRGSSEHRIAKNQMQMLATKACTVAAEFRDMEARAVQRVRGRALSLLGSQGGGSPGPMLRRGSLRPLGAAAVLQQQPASPGLTVIRPESSAVGPSRPATLSTGLPSSSDRPNAGPRSCGATAAEVASVERSPTRAGDASASRILPTPSPPEIGHDVGGGLKPESHARCSAPADRTPSRRRSQAGTRSPSILISPPPSPSSYATAKHDPSSEGLDVHFVAKAACGGVSPLADSTRAGKCTFLGASTIGQASLNDGIDVEERLKGGEECGGNGGQCVSLVASMTRDPHESVVVRNESHEMLDLNENDAKAVEQIVRHARSLDRLAIEFRERADGQALRIETLAREPTLEETVEVQIAKVLATKRRYQRKKRILYGSIAAAVTLVIILVLVFTLVR